jgi:CBS-domain-containing membrane protein
MMAFEGMHRVPVVSASDTVVGIVSSIDVLRWIAQTEGYLVGRPAPVKTLLRG